MSKDTNLGKLGYTFQIRLLSELMLDKNFANTIIDILDPTYFDGQYLRFVFSKIKDFFEKYDTIPDFNTLISITNSEVKKNITRECILETIKEIRESKQKDVLYVQETALKFCKQQELKKAHIQINAILESGDFDRYDECEEILKEALSVGDNKDTYISVFDNLDDVLSDDFRSPIPTGITGLDLLMEGGLSRGELGVILAPFGTGKTTMLTRIANTAYNHGLNVVQIFFEDQKKVIQRKHITCWSEIPLNELNDKKKDALKITKEYEGREGNLILEKFPSDSTSINHIRQFLRKLISEGIKPDVIIVDYIDCVVPTKSFDNEFNAEGSIMRQFETMISEFDVAGWTAVQGNRSSIGANVVEANQMGGSIKKGQIGHFIVSIAKTLEQKEDGTATMAILKSRFGKDGVVFDDILFDNSTLKIDTDSSSDVSFLDFDKKREKKRIENALGKTSDIFK